MEVPDYTENEFDNEKNRKTKKKKRKMKIINKIHDHTHEILEKMERNSDDNHSSDDDDDGDEHDDRKSKLSHIQESLGISSKAPTEEWTYKRRNCWVKIYKSILKAKYFIYITGWSVDTSISLIREKPIYKNKKSPQDDEDNGMLTIGELLKRKANEGVRVCLLLWNEATSLSGSKKEGMMNTHDELTKLYFANSNVHVSLVYRDSSSPKSKFLWTHHQKSIILDAPSTHTVDILTEFAHLERRRIISFVGGLDLCDGRWDTPEHFLYKTLETFHKNDFHTVWPGITNEYGPREPWHDIHCMLEGSIARDVLRNFEQRWKKQVSHHLDVLFDYENHNRFISVDDEDIFPDNHWNSWNVQLFRSIDKYSAIMESSDQKIDQSIHTAYIHHIRRAKRFIFIENQYFIGSSQSWLNNEGKNIECNNLIPLELTLRIISAINNDERFCVYILLPLYPEGIPADSAVQAILYWQFKTIEMMYYRIYLALKDKNLLQTYKPEDYLNFYCMGQREIIDPSFFNDKPPFDKDSRPFQFALNNSNRFAIYVHSKMMIIDDDYIIVGSANINERSMAGNRDSEIAIGAYQPHFISETSANQPRGQIHAFRLSLFYSHTRKNLPCFLSPESIDCVRSVNEIARNAWHLFSADEPVHLESHGQLLKYPLSVSDMGVVCAIPGNEFIPDTTASITGSTTMIPDILTL